MEAHSKTQPPTALNGDELDPRSYYAAPGPMTDPRQYANMLDDLPTSISELCQVIQGNLLHIFWAERYGRKLSEEEQQTVGLRHVYEKLGIIREADDRPLTEVRPLEKRHIGNCRDFTLLLTAILRHQGVPARARCGFGTYFLPDHYEDHWVCEYWNAPQESWVLVDAQMDEFQRQVLQLDFDPLDVPRDRFIVAGQAWQMCRSGQMDPEKFGIFDMHGLWFVRGNLVRDILAFNKIEILPWDGGWGLLQGSEDPAEEERQNAFCDHLAVLTLDGDDAFPELRTVYDQTPGLHVPEEYLA